MKKSVIVLIGVIYVLSIFLVSFLGLKIDVYNQTIYTTGLEITNELDDVTCKVSEENKQCVKEDAKGVKYAIVYYDDDLTNPTSFQISWRVHPDDASDKNVKFIYDVDSGVATVNSFGTVIFKKRGTVTITVSTCDGTNISAKIKVIAK